MQSLINSVRNMFTEKFTEGPHLYYSPGRINLIGEHIDYNDGYVMPASIDKGIVFAVALNNSDEINFYSIDFKEAISINIHAIKKLDGWKDYVLSVVNEFQLLHLPVKGFNCVFGGNIPVGAGLSSSAAAEGGVAFALNELCNFNLNRKDLALLCQRAEHSFPGVQCGIMDQYASICGKKDEVIFLDCLNITHDYLPLHLHDYTIILINSNVHHSLASSAYNTRRQECENGLMILKEAMHITSFRDVPEPADLLAVKNKMGEEVYMRCLFVVEEIKRTKDAAQFLKENNIKAFGRLMFQAHEGLKNLYKVSCREIDFLVDCAVANKAVAGSRIMGGGFGGCTINIVRQNDAADFSKNTISAYKKEFDIEAEVYEVNVVDGTHSL